MKAKMRQGNWFVRFGWFHESPQDEAVRPPPFLDVVDRDNQIDPIVDLACPPGNRLLIQGCRFNG